MDCNEEQECQMVSHALWCLAHGKRSTQDSQNKSGSGGEEENPASCENRGSRIKKSAMAISNCLPVLKHFIGGYSLRTGTIFTGWLGLAGDILGLVLSVVYLLIYDREIPDWELLLVIAVGESAVSGSVHGLLLYGAYKVKRSFLVPYLILGAVSVITRILGLIIFGIYAFLYGGSITAVSILLAGVVIAVFLAYLWLVVYSYYQQLRKSTVHGHQGFIQTVLTMAENGEDCMSHDKFMACEKCDVAAGTDTFRTENN